MEEVLTTKTKFKPMLIGVDERAIKLARKAWIELCEASNEVQIQLANFLDVEEISNEDLIEYFSLDFPELLTRLYQDSGKVPEGFSAKKLAQMQMIDNVHTQDIAPALEYYKNAKAQAEKLFRYDLISLRGEDLLFEIDEKFNTALKGRYSVYTKSEEESEMLIHLNALVEEINWFAQKGLVRPKHGPQNALTGLMSGLKLQEDRMSYKPYLNIFELSRWKIFRA